MVRKTDAIKKSQTENVSELRPFFGLINEYNKFVAKLLLLNSPLRPLLNKQSVYQWDNRQNFAFEKLKSEKVNFTEKSHFDIKENIKLKTEASHNGLGATLGQFQGG